MILFEVFDYSFFVVFFLSIFIGYALLAMVILWFMMMYFVYANCYLGFRLNPKKGGKTARKIVFNVSFTFLVITGASSGIGFELARQFISEEWNLVIVSRNPRKIKAAKKMLEDEVEIRDVIVSIRAFCLDLSKPDSAKKLVQKLEEDDIAIDCLVNNAGFGYAGDFLDQDDENIIRMMNLNMTTLTLLTRYLLPSMIKKRYGRIFNVASFSAYQPTPGYAVYSATKHYVRGFSLALSEELSEFPNVTCTTMCPGFVLTNFNNVALGRNRESLLSRRMKYQSAEECAFEGYRALMKKELECIPGVENWVYAKYIIPFIPTRLGLKILRWVTKLKRKEETEKKKKKKEEKDEEEDVEEKKKEEKMD